MTVSIIIVNFNTALLVRNCIRSIIAHTNDVAYEIILLDNHSAERSIDEVAAAFPEVRFIQEDTNLGFGKACNRAVREAKGTFYFFLNPDTVLKNNAVRLLLDFWQQHDGELNIACLGAFLYDAEGKPIHSAHDFPEMKVLLKHKLRSTLARLTGRRSPMLSEAFGEGSVCKKVDYVTGADLFISRDNFELVNGFDPAFFMYFEETDLQFRLRQAGKQSFLVAGPVIHHKQGASTEGDQKRLRVLYRDSMLAYFKKHNAPGHFRLFKYIWYVVDFVTFIQKITLKSLTH